MGGFLSKYHGTSLSTFSVTHPDVYDYSPSNTTSLQLMVDKGAGDILVYRTKKICRDIIMPWVMCLLYERCAQPMAHTPCIIRQWDVFTCHRFDQSAINVLIHNRLGFKPDNSWPLRASPQVVVVHRNGKKDANPDKPNMCITKNVLPLKRSWYNVTVL